MLDFIKTKIQSRAQPNKAEEWYFAFGENCEGMKAAGYRRLIDCPEVRVAIERIADLISNMTIHLMENGEQGDIRVENELSRKVDINPCNYMTGQLWVHWIVKSLLMNGNGIVYPDIKNGIIEELLPIPYSKVGFDNNDLFSYKVRIQDRYYNSNEVLHFRINPQEDKPWMGEGYQVTLRDVIENLAQSTKTTNEFMSNRVIPNLIVKVDAFTDELATEEGRARVYDKYLTASRAGEPWIIPSGLMDVQQVKPLTLNDIAIKDTIDISKSTVAAIMGIPSFLLGIGKFNEKEYNNFIRTRIMTIAKAIEQELTKKLLIKPEWYFKFNAQSLYSYGIDEMASVYSRLYAMGLYTGNEVRDKLGDSPRDELNELSILENYIPIDKIGDQKKLGGGNKEDERPQESEPEDEE